LLHRRRPYTPFVVDHPVARHIIFDEFILNAAKCLGNNA